MADYKPKVGSINMRYGDKPIDHRPTIAPTPEPNRQRHDVPWSQPVVTPEEAQGIGAEVREDFAAAVAETEAMSARLDAIADASFGEPEPPAREPAAGRTECDFCGCQTNAHLRRCCLTGETWDKAWRRGYDSERAAHAAEVERLRGELADTKTRLGMARTEAASAARDWWWRGHDSATVSTCNALSDALDRGNLGTFADPTMQALAHRIETLHRRYRDAKTELAEARARPVPSDPTACYCSQYQSSGLPCPPGRCPNVPTAALLGVGRPVPTREQLLEALGKAEDAWSVDRDDLRGSLEVHVDAVLALFGAEPKGQPEPADQDRDKSQVYMGSVSTTEPADKRIERLESELNTAIAGCAANVEELQQTNRDVACHDRFIDALRDRCAALERAVRGLTEAARK